MVVHTLLLAAGSAAGGGLLAGALTTLFLRYKAAAEVVHAPVPAPTIPAKVRLLMAVEQVVAALPLAVMVLDKDRRLLYASPHAYRDFPNALGSIERHPAFQSALDRLATRVNTRQAENEEARIVLDIPVHRVVQAFFQKTIFSKEAFATEYGRPEGGPNRTEQLSFIALHDVTEAEMTERQHTDFVAYASHELRTPLAALMGFIETLQGPAADDPEAQREFLEIMAAQGRRMQRLLDGLLYLSRVQMLEHQRPKGRVILADLCVRLQNETSILFRQNEAELVIEPPAHPDIAVVGDEDQLLQVLINLVENALKYGGCDTENPRTLPLAVTVSFRKAEPLGGWPAEGGVVLSVSDNGPGIAARHLPRLTERFYRVPKTSAMVQGSGLGLAIVQHVVTRHGGRFMVESTVGSGTDCLIWLPIADPAGASQN